MLSATYVNTYVCMYKLCMYRICPYEGLAWIEGRTEGILIQQTGNSHSLTSITVGMHVVLRLHLSWAIRKVCNMQLSTVPGCLGKPWLAGEGPALHGVTTLLLSLGRFGGGCRSERPGGGRVCTAFTVCVQLNLCSCGFVVALGIGMW